LQPTAAFAEPKLGRDGQIDKSLEDVRHRSANEHLGFRDRAIMDFWHVISFPDYGHSGRTSESSDS
jgi:hypothetical protein